MPNLHVVYDCIGWAYFHRAEALRKYAPPEWTVTTGDEKSRWFDADVVLWLPYGSLKHVRITAGALGKSAPIIVSGYNCGVGYRRELFDECLTLADHVVINNRANWDRIGRPKRTTWISNGVDLDVFKPIVPPKDRTPKVISCGSNYHLKHNDDLKGLRSHLMPLGKMLAKDGIACEWKTVDSTKPGGLLDQSAMNRWYNTGTVYVVASRSEGTPNPALEAAAAGCVIVSTNVGNMVELIDSGRNGRLVKRDLMPMFHAVKWAVRNYRELSANMQEAIKPWHWAERANLYFGLFDQLLTERRASC